MIKYAFKMSCTLLLSIGQPKTFIRSIKINSLTKYTSISFTKKIMENLNDKGLYLDELQKLRVLDPEITAQVKI